MKLVQMTLDNQGIRSRSMRAMTIQGYCFVHSLCNRTILAPRCEHSLLRRHEQSHPRSNHYVAGGVGLFYSALVVALPVADVIAVSGRERWRRLRQNDQEADSAAGSRTLHSSCSA